MVLVPDEELQQLAEEKGPASAEAQALAQLKTQRSQDLQVHCFRVGDSYLTGPLADTTGREAKLTLLGLGQIGRELARQLIAQQPHLRRDLGIDLKVVAVADREVAAHALITRHRLAAAGPDPLENLSWE